jgi:2-amino-4-hydroxy-6-hydroxymethyldihydropteridine diphosphokinase
VIRTAHHYFLGLGSNLGNRAANLAQGIEGVGSLPGAKVLAISPVFDSDPVGFTEQPNFLNICLSLSCELKPRDLLAAALALETQAGRVRSSNKNGPRTLDVDLLFWDGGEHRSPELTLPHPRWKERGFVTVPLRHLLQSATLASDPRWDWLRHEILTAPTGGDELRAWQGSTPWRPTPG